MPYCPKCGAEYREGIKVCADCNVELVDTMPDFEVDKRNFIEFYTCFDALELGRISEILSEKGIKTLIRDLRSSAFPTDIGETAEKRLSVPEEDLEEAVKLVKTAIVDGEISPDGHFMN
ncbi:MAG: hypothetical protein GXP49_00650 [Deltaproteobacteria bacterium]|nr:hypothetical protein [Deltaproteobacteria bacterium]